MQKKNGTTVVKKENSKFLSALFFAKDISGIGSARVRRPLFSKLGRLADRISKTVTYTSTRTFGYMLISFGLVSLIMHLAKYYFMDDPVVQLSTLITSAVLAIVGLPLIFIDKPMCLALQDFVLTDYIFFEFFSIKRMRSEENVRTIHPIVGVLIGFVPAVFAFFFSIEAVLGVLLGLLFVAVSLVSPEFPFLFLILAIPYINLIPASDIVLVGIVLLILVSFFRKVLLGKRVYVFGISDVLIFIFVAIIIGFGVIGGGSESTLGAWIMAAATLGYIPTANMIVNRRLADCTVNAVIVSAVPASLYSVVTYIIGLANGEMNPTGAFMQSPESFAAFLAVATVMTLFLAREFTGIKRVPYVLSAVLFALALFATQCAPVLLLLPLGVIAYLLITMTRLPGELLLVLYLVPLAVFFLPGSVLYTVSDTLDMPLTLGEMRAQFASALDIFASNVFVGVGADGTANASTAPVFNTMLAFACKFGVFAFVAVALIVILRLRQVSVYSRYLNSSSLRSLSDMTLLSIFVLLVFGWFYDVTASPDIYLLFFSVFGMSTASLRVSKREYDDSLGYFGDNIGADSSDADITIKR